MQWPLGLGCSKLGKDNPRLEWNLVLDLKVLKENSATTLLIYGLMIGSTKKNRKNYPKTAFI